MKFKKILATVLAGVLAVSLTACNNNPNDKGNFVSCDHEYTSTVTEEATYDSEGVMTYVCGKCGDTYTATIEKLTKHIIPTAVLEDALFSCKCSSGYPVAVGKVIEYGMKKYEIQYLTGEEAIALEYITEKQIREIDTSFDINYVYYAIISGDTVFYEDYDSPVEFDVQYRSDAAKVLMIFDENDRLQNSKVELCPYLKVAEVNVYIIEMLPSY